MKLSMKHWRSGLVVIGALVALIGATVAFAGNPSPGVLPSNSPPSGKTFEELNASWWQWFFSVPASKNPGLAENGAVDCRVGQSGKVWFLAGKFLSGGTFIRSCTIPVGRALFIPLINSWADNVCNNGIGKNLPPQTVDQLHDFAESLAIPSTNLHASIDDSPLLSQRAKSPVFSYNLPGTKDNVINASSFTDNNGTLVKLPGPCWPSLHVYPAVADGFYTMLPPLTAGSHTLKFGGTAPTGSTLDVTYHLTVK